VGVRESRRGYGLTRLLIRANHASGATVAASGSAASVAARAVGMGAARRSTQVPRVLHRGRIPVPER
jgi:hypothetical protein